MWTEPVALQILSVFFPIVRTWPREATAELIGLTRAALRSMALQDDRWHYQEVLEHVAGKPPGETVVLTGHSLGGGMALVVGALTGRLAVALQPPGVYHSLAKHQTDRAINGDKAVHQRSVTLKFEGDWIQHFDDHGGLVQTMACDRSHQGVQLACHMVEGAVCHLLRHCGDEEQRFWRCSHEYAPSSALREVLNALGAWLRQIWVRSRWRREEMFGDLWAKVVSAVCISVAFLLRPQRGPTPAAEGAAARRQESR
ncbi:unnamed protein product [Prorocentrum cordatum]|uniref:Fungal lipase-type domain-containing protein n=1 Tax=Prorocentrum cordatum TaxID=2364126 RepID=A0ABN9XW94_9DINO|nr:unnamed protein product [Polarella glacialis]